MSPSTQQHPVAVVASISSGGALGAMTRKGLSVAVPHSPGGMPLATIGINISGCLLIGILMVLLDQAWREPRLLRPFLGVGILGGYTTFSTYAVDIQQAIAQGSPRMAAGYLGLTIVTTMLAVVVGTVVARGLLSIQARRGRSGVR